MAELPLSPQGQAAGPNLPVFTVTEIAFAIKRTIEGAFGRVRVRGEISSFKRAASGHLYFCLKDTDAVIDAVVWRMTANGFSLKPEDGMEVIVTGRVTTYGPQSKYQLIIEEMDGLRVARVHAAKRGTTGSGDVPGVFLQEPRAGS